MCLRVKEGSHPGQVVRLLQSRGEPSTRRATDNYSCQSASGLQEEAGESRQTQGGYANCRTQEGPGNQTVKAVRQQCYANCHLLKLLRGSELNVRCNNMHHRPWRETFRATSLQTKQKERQTKTTEKAAGKLQHHRVSMYQSPHVQTESHLHTQPFTRHRFRPTRRATEAIRNTQHRHSAS